MAELQDSDLMLVERGGTSYKVPGSDVIAKLKSDVPPFVEAVVVTETDSTGPRFTNQSFNMTSVMALNGEPASTKAIDAYVEGSIVATGNFDATPTSVTGTTGPNYTSITTSAPTLLSNRGIDYLYSKDQYAQSNSIGINDTTVEPIRFTLSTPITGVEKLELIYSNVGSMQQSGGSFDWYGRVSEGDDWIQGNRFDSLLGTTPKKDWPGRVDISEQIPSNGEITGFQFGVKRRSSSGNAYVYPGGVMVNGVVLTDDELRTVLSFPSGTNMDFVEGGDYVKQTDTTLSARTWSSGLSVDKCPPNTGNPYSNAFNGNISNSANATCIGATMTWDIGTSISGKLRVALPSSTSSNSQYQIYLNGSFYGEYIAMPDEEVGPNNRFIDGVDLVNVSTIGVFRSGSSDTQISGFYINDQIVVDGQALAVGPSGQVIQESGTTLTVTGGSGSWDSSKTVVGDTKTLTLQNARRYLKFDSSGNVSDLLESPQSPAYTTSSTEPSFSFLFPSTFASGGNPDYEILDGCALNVSVTASNVAGTDTEVGSIVPNSDVNEFFNTTLYTGSGAEKNIITGMNLQDNEGLVWIKGRNNTYNHALYDTTRGAFNVVSSNTSEAQVNEGAGYFGLGAFNPDGFRIGTNVTTNDSGKAYVAWTWKKAPRFFDVVTYTATQQPTDIPHNLGCQPGWIFVKSITGGSSNWYCYSSTFGALKFTELNQSSSWRAAGSGPGTTNNIWNGTEPTDTHFTIGDDIGINNNGVQYVAYLWAEDEQFCKVGSYGGGSYNGTSDASRTVVDDVGFRPQFVMIKGGNGGFWCMMDDKRGGSAMIQGESYGGENNPYSNSITFTDDGFIIQGTNGGTNTYPEYTYLAIAAPPQGTTFSASTLSAQKLRFATYENRKQVAEGTEATTERANLIEYLNSRGFDSDDVDDQFA